MVAQLIRHELKWLSPSSMWASFGDLANDDSRQCFNRPAILRFNRDDFMDELLALMSYYPDQLAEWIVKPETWREPMPTPRTAAKLLLAEPVSQLSKQQTRAQLKRESAATNALSADALKTAFCMNEQDPEKPLKLYQPAQQRFYLVTASLVCRRAGLPDRLINSGKQEQPGFVLRRLIPTQSDSIKTPDTCNPDECDEYALVQTANGQQWRNITQHKIFNENRAVPNEERLPMSTIGFTDNEERKRRLLTGFIPVGKREAYLGAMLFDESIAGNELLEGASADEALKNAQQDAIIQLFELDVAGPWKALIDQAETEKFRVTDEEFTKIPSYFSGDSPDSPDADLANNIKNSREQIQTISWYVLVDLLKFLKKYINNIYLVIAGEKNSSELSPGKEQELYTALENVVLHGYLKAELDTVDSHHNASQISDNLIQALQTILNNSNIENNLEKVDVAYDQSESDFTSNLWPPFLFPLADPEVGKIAPLPVLAIDNTIITEPEKSQAKINVLSELVRDALPDEIISSAPEIVSFKPTELDNGDGWFVIRCIHEQPNCGAFFPAVLSEPTEAFKMASFFDPDAPGRAIRIPMPLDISPAGLRKFNKNTTLMISDMLCGKIKSIKKITFGDLVLSVLPWPFHKDLPNVSKTGPCGSPGNTFGMFCSLSIPIVTLCALILLIIMVSLFDLFFRWIPLLFTCFPLPGLKAKKS